MMRDRQLLAAVAKTIDAAAHARGADYAQRGHVLNVQRGIDGGFEAVVQGSREQPYLVEIFGDDDFDEGESICSCPVGGACKHVAAVLAHLGFKTPATMGEPSPPTPRARREVALWLEKLSAPPAAVHAPAGQNRVAYVLDLRHEWGPRGYARYPCVLLAKTRPRKNGTFGVPQGTRSSATSQMPTYADEADRGLIARLWAMREPHVHSLVLDGKGAAQLVKELVATGRCFLAEGRNACTWGAPKRGEAGWQLDQDGVQRFIVRVGTKPADVWTLDTPLYAQGDVLGPVELDLAPEKIRWLADAPALGPEDLTHVHERIAEAKLPTPQLIELRRHEERPRPGARLEFGPLILMDQRRRGLTPRVVKVPRVVPRFLYGDHWVSASSPRPELRVVEGNVVHLYPRDRTLEDQAYEFLLELGLERPLLAPWVSSREAMDALIFPETGDPTADAEFSDTLELALLGAGWHVERAPDYPYGSITEIDALHTSVSPAARSHWFEVALDIEVDGKRVPLLPLLVQALRQLPHGDFAAATQRLAELPLALPDGRFVKLGPERVEGILAVLLALYDREPSGEVLDLSAHDVASLGTASHALADETLAYLRAYASGAIEKRAAKLDAADLEAKLRDYQTRGVAWLELLAQHGQSGVLADDMGLGKTVQAIAHLLWTRRVTAKTKRRPNLVVAPTSLLPNWKDELARFAPTLRVLTLHGATRKTKFDEIAASDVVLTSYPLLARDIDALADAEFGVVIMDEAQAIKNPLSQTHRAAKRLRASERLCLTGTPLENHLGELWALFDFVQPGLLGTSRQFREHFRTPIEQHKDAAVTRYLARRVQPFLLRRTKDQVAPELPAKTEIIQHAELEGAQRDLYESVRLSMEERVRDELRRLGVKRSSIVVLDALLKLRQVCCDPRLVKSAAKKGRAASSAKLELLFELLPELLAEGRRVLLFSQFTSMLALIEAELEARKLPYVMLTGDTHDRRTPVQAFQRGEVPLFLLSLKAGGTGLNLTAADTVIHFDPWWNPAVEAQATDRAHRIGQDKPVFVYKLVVRGSVEERMLELQERKRHLTQQLLAGDDAGGLAALDEGEITSLFAPLA